MTICAAVAAAFALLAAAPLATTPLAAETAERRSSSAHADGSAEAERQHAVTVAASPTTASDPAGARPPATSAAAAPAASTAASGQAAGRPSITSAEAAPTGSATASGGAAVNPSAGAEANGGSPAAPGLRLPRAFLPRSNRVRLTLDPARERFEGRIEIDAAASEPLRSFWLHAENIEIDEARATAGGESWPLEVLAPDGDRVGLRSSREIPAGLVTVAIVYRGRIDDKETKGIFRQKEGDDWYVFSQFEALGARRAFPCFDEPDSKVPWQLTLEVPEGLAALSNTQVASETATGRGTRAVTFRPTRPLPSYLVAFAVGPFDLVNAGETRHGTPVRIVVPRGRSADVSYVIENTTPILTILEDYFAIPYPFDKLDLVAIPVTVGFGAMENPGLVTFNQRLLVARREDFTISFRRRFAAVVAHELAHQWFGDLVTLAWWDDLWLNEAFASWMGERVVRQWKPEWGGDVGLVTRRSGAIASDSLQTARKIRQPIQSAHDIENAFDGITYAKGASVIATFEKWMGGAKFREGVRAYMRKHSWGNATAADFLGAMNEAAGRDVATPFSTFLDQVGAPLVGVDLVCEGKKRPRLRLSQERYLPLGSQAERRVLWQVPVCVTYPAGKGLGGDCTVLAERSAELELSEASSCPAWIAPNAEGIGYYRSDLRGGLLSALLDRGMKKLSLPERVAAIGDVSALVGAGKADIGQALGLVERYARDDSRHVVAAVSAIAGGIRDTVPDALRPNYARFIRKMFGERARRLGWTPGAGDDDDTRLLRVSLLALVTDEGRDAALAAEARTLAFAWLADHGSVDPNLVGVALEAAALSGDAELFERFHEAARRAKDRRDRQRLLSALASFRDPELAGRARAIALTDEFDIREAAELLYAGLSEPRTRRQAYDFVKTNIDAILTRMPERSGRGLIRAATEQCDPSLAPDIEAVFKDRMGKIQGGPRVYQQALEQIDLCVKRRETQRPGITSFLKKY